jgi:hypothetical protein
VADVLVMLFHNSSYTVTDTFLIHSSLYSELVTDRGK